MFASGKTAAVASAANYIEDVFSTYLYTGNDTSQTITNGIDLAGEGGLVWMKGRSGATAHALYDTLRGATKDFTIAAAAETTQSTGLTSFGSTGFSIGALAKLNTNAATYASWTFRKQPKFFTFGTYTGTGSVQNISHDLGSVPGFVMVKAIGSSNSWKVQHRSTGATNALELNDTRGSSDVDIAFWNNTSPTSTQFTVGTNAETNGSGVSFMYYLFAHDAGGFGLTGTDNVISCGSFTTDGSGAYSVTLGYEPQFVLMKRTDSTGDWLLMDNMRGMPVGGNDAILRPNTSGAETQTFDCANPSATGFYESTGSLGLNRTFIYIAIRRGPMKVPTSGTSVFSPTIVPTAYSTSAAGPTPTDMSMLRPSYNGSNNWRAVDRLRGNDLILMPNQTNAESSESFYKFDTQSGLRLTSWPVDNSVFYNFKRAPSFFDVVCYTGNDVLRTINHNLGVAPEMMIIKIRDSALDWAVYHAGMGNTKYIWLNRTDAALTSSTYWNNTSPTASVFTINTTNKVNSAPSPYVAYLFATCAGVSKVGSYTGTGTTLQVNCGFTGGARFVLIKRTDSTGDWYVWDTARGIVSGNDPYLLLNSTAAEVTNTDYVDTYSAGFEISSTAPAAINASGGTFIFLAIA